MKPTAILEAKASSFIQPNRGFTLVITLSLMVLLTVIAVGLLTLSSISVRTTSNTLDVSRARANARMAMMFAIGELQKQAGLDTRVTARADILDETNGPVLGVWKSWEGEDHVKDGNFEGRPISPGNNYRSVKSQHFLGWLTSAPDPLTIPDTTSGDKTVVLVGKGSVGDADPVKFQVHLKPTEVNIEKTKGTFAWWIGGENQKARISKSYQPESLTSPAGWASISKSHSTANPATFGLDSLLDPNNFDKADKIITRQQTELIAERAAIDYFHDLSAVSTGLLTNTATGGWRKDLSLFTENYNSLGSGNLPLYRTTPTKDNQCRVSPPSGSSSPPKSILYPWAVPGSQRNVPGAVASWGNLKDYVLSYQKFSGGGPYSLPTNWERTDHQYLNSNSIEPVLARLQWVYSHSARPVGGGAQYNPGLLITPVITFWNPYNIAITVPSGAKVRVGAGGSVNVPPPPALTYTVGGVALPTVSLFRSNNYGENRLTDSSVSCDIASNQLNLAPGEMKVFSPSAGETIETAADQHYLIKGTITNPPIELSAGCRLTDGIFIALKDPASASPKDLKSPASTTMAVNARFDTNCINTNQPGYPTDPSVGIELYLSAPGASTSYTMYCTPEIALNIYPPFPVLSPSGALQSLVTAPVPFMSMIFGNRVANNSMLPTKGFVQSSPFTTYCDFRYDSNRGQSRYRGVNHPINAPFDFSFVKHGTVAGAVAPPPIGSSTGYGFSGFDANTGLTRCIVAEIPLQPLASLAELQHWDLKGQNTAPPFAFNIIGNSDATPLLPKNKVVHDQRTPLSRNSTPDSESAGSRQYDDSYCANHLLFDDWFFSSISAGNSNDFGRSGSLQQSYTNFIKGERPLTNRSYKPLLEDASFAQASAGNADSLYNSHVANDQSWRTIASRLEVEGMFNVNSTSEAAWSALLSHARNQKVPIHAAGSGLTVSANENNVFSRTTVAGDNKAGSTTGNSGFEGANELVGFRAFTDTQIENFAKQIVIEVRKRGPFLSLSEFINRQLTDEVDLALAGTIQSALNTLGGTPGNPSGIYAAFQSKLSPQNAANKLAVAPTAKVLQPAGSAFAQFGAEYEPEGFPEAAIGSSHYGMPGWTRQADVLRPIAPILSARDDTFVIRSYGDSRDASGNKILARAVCEVIVRRSRNYCDSSEPADLTTPVQSEINLVHGRRFEVVSFRWLSEADI